MKKTFCRYLKISTRWKTLFFLIIVSILSISIISINNYIAKGQSQRKPTPLGLPAGLPDLTRIAPQDNKSTATPVIPPLKTNIYLMTASPVTPYPTPSEIVVSKVTDLSPDIADADKFHIYVRHPDGTIEEFNVGLLHSQSDMMNGELPSYILTRIPLKTGDEIISWILPVPFQRYAPGALETLEAVETLKADSHQPTPFYSTPFPTQLPTPRTYP